MKSYRLTIITPTFNNGDIIADFLETIKKQDFKPELFEHLIVDGGSSDQTLKIAAKYRCQILSNPKVLAEYGVSLGMNKARGELLMILAVDNFLEAKNALSIMVRAFDDPEIFAAFPKQDSDDRDSIWSKYVNTFTDPFNHFVYGDSANSRTFKNVYKTLKARPTYDVYDYLSNPTLPMIAFAQGLTIRREFKRHASDEADDCMPIIRLIQEKRQIAYVHRVSLYHHTIKNLGHFVKKQRWATLNAISGKKYGINHRQQYLSNLQRYKQKIWPIYAFSIVGPTIYALYYFMKSGEWLWLLHPLMCFTSALSSTQAVLLNLLGTTKIARQ